MKCTKCGDYVCRGKAMYYKPPLNKLCDKCRKKELIKIKDDGD